MPLIPFPDIPNVAGVPAIARSALGGEVSAIVGSANALVSGALSSLPSIPSLSGLASQNIPGLPMQPISPVWGVFDKSGQEVLFPDSFIGIEYKNGSRVSDYPVEKGAFASYNKVDTPWDIRVRMAIGTSNASRSAFIVVAESMLHSTELFDIVTPEKVYLNGTLDNIDYRRDSKNGVSLLTVDLMFTEVRETGGAQYSEPTNSTSAPIQPLPAAEVQSPSSASPVSDGQLQGTPPTAEQDASTNYVAGSVNDTLGSTLSPQQAAQLSGPADPAANAAKLQDRLNNPPPGLNADELAKYKTGITARYGPSAS